MSSFPSLTIEQLLELMPRLKRQNEDRVADILRFLNQAMEQGEINTPKRQAAFLAQLGHESLDLTRWVEMDHSTLVRGCPYCADFGTHRAGAQYEGRRALGNTQPGDGERYKGRGPIQLTGRSNYRAAGNALQLPLVEDPDRAAYPEVGFQVAVWFWNKNSLSTQADIGGPAAFDRITKRINGGYNGKEDRDIRYLNALKLLQRDGHPDGGRYFWRLTAEGGTSSYFVGTIPEVDEHARWFGMGDDVTKENLAPALDGVPEKPCDGEGAFFLEGKCNACGWPLPAHTKRVG